MARAKKLSKTHHFKVSVPQQTHDYLVLLASKGKLGATVSDVASVILIDATEAKLSGDYHLKEVPKSNL
ncbi:MAG: hypothetical protein ACTHPD_00325 [Rhizomicrobium sp.]